MKRFALILCVALVGLVSFAPRAEAREPFEQGSVRISANVGSARAFDETYVAIGAGGGYYVVDGLELGLDGSVWLGPGPSIGTLGPRATYVLHFVPVLKPYVGGFYRHWFIGEGIDDQDSVGARFGAYYVSGRGFFLGGGAAYEHTLACSSECGTWWPEVALSVSF